MITKTLDIHFDHPFAHLFVDVVFVADRNVPPNADVIWRAKARVDHEIFDPIFGDGPLSAVRKEGLFGRPFGGDLGENAGQAFTSKLSLGRPLRSVLIEEKSIRPVVVHGDLLPASLGGA